MRTKFRTTIGETVFRQKYALHKEEDWTDRARCIVDSVCNPHLPKSTQDAIFEAIRDFKFLPGGRYIYYAGRSAKFYNNCYLLRAEEDTREEWARLTGNATNCLMSGGGIGVDYSRLRPAGRLLKRTGGTSSGPIPLMHTINEVGRNVMQGGSRRSAIYASLDREHEDICLFLIQKNWHHLLIKGAHEPINDWFTVKEAKEWDFNFPAPLDMTNISVNYKDSWGFDPKDPIFVENVHQAMMTGEPGFSFNFGNKQNETLRNACTEVTSEDDSDVCNLGSVNMANIDSLKEFRDIVGLATEFLMCGLLEAQLPYEEVYRVREKNSRVGLGLMGMHEWLLKRGEGYEVTEELATWLQLYQKITNLENFYLANRLGIAQPVALRAIAPTGTIGMLAGTTTGIEPIYTIAYKRRYLTAGTIWNYQYMVDPTARAIVEEVGVDPDSVETALTMSTSLNGLERRIKFQYEVQRYIDQGISSTINLPAWGTEFNHEGRLPDVCDLIARYSAGLRGLTFYPDGSRGGQPLTPVSYNVAANQEGKTFEEGAIDVCDITGKGGTCGA